MISINLKDNLGIPWVTENNVSIKGYISDLDGNNIDISQLSEIISECECINTLESYIKSIRGMFSLVINFEDRVYLISDNIRSYPIFYKKNDGNIYISDNVDYLNSISSSHISLENRNVFLSTGYTVGNSTLYDDVFQVQACEIVELTKSGTIKEKEYWNYRVENIIIDDLPSLKKKGTKLIRQSVKRVISSVNGRQIVVPISGGYDSRLILTLLKHFGCKDVVCFTYGSPKSKELDIAVSVAKILGFKCHVIHYTEKFVNDYLDIDELNGFMNYACRASSVPHLQDFLAVKYMKENSLIASDAIFLPGHSGDIFAGTHIIDNVDKETKRSVVEEGLKRKHFRLAEYKGDPNFSYYNPKCYAYSNMEAWSWKERQSKFIVNSIRAYEFFGYEARIPLWDYDLADFFKNIPLEQKNRRNSKTYTVESNLYDSICYAIFKGHGVDMFQRPTDHVITRLLRRVLSRLTNYDGVNNLDLIISKLSKKEKIKFTSTKFNGKVAELQLHLMYGTSK